MRVLEMITPSRIGGAEMSLLSTVRALEASGDEVTVFCPSGRPIVNWLKRNGINPVTWTTWGKFDPATVLRLTRLMRERRIDVVHTHLSTAGLLGALAAKRAGIPSVATIHGFNSVDCYQFTTRLVAVSQAVKEHLVALKMPASKIDVVHQGIDTNRFVPIPLIRAKRQFGYSFAQPRIGVFGGISAVYGQDLALQALARIVAQIHDVQLMIVGDGEDREQLEARAQTLPLKGHVEFLPFTEKAHELMSACDIVLAPSRKEGFSIAALSGMALARPVIVSNCGGLAEMVPHGRVGLRVQANDVPALAEAMLMLLRMPERAAAMGKAGRQLVEECFDIDQQTPYLRQVMRTATLCNIGVAPEFGM